ncbi:hypothetical protein MXMO3_02383 [Maritalea myrionectae]|uniref:Uncharacterized protein n=1 Tax=Maritalea myrionectae TaxID=454601 RepID=A0A2R4MG83_9HYPH|nr:hypothetical protein [Maritalea myrionectae]AVX04896.1 hypothetical protein MXMO3_02383 [Maritalea myrionectae]
MSELITLRGMTWDHIRGFDPMVVTSEVFCDRHDRNVRIVWEKRSLQAFADRPIEEMAEYDLMVIDHPHVGDIADTGILTHFDGQGFDPELTTLETQSAGLSHPSYAFNGHQWALAIDAATPVSAVRPDLLPIVPEHWDEVVELAEAGKVIWPLIPINALMSLFNVLANIDEDFGQGEQGMDVDVGEWAIGQMMRVARHLPRESFDLDPIAAYEWLSCRSAQSYCPYLYGYTNYARAGFRPHLVTAANIPAFGSNGPKGSPIGGTGIAVSSRSRHQQIALEYAFWIASADCQKGLFFDAGGQPGNRVAWTDARCNSQSADFFNNTLETLERSYLRPRHKGYMWFQDRAGEFVRNALMEEISVGEAIRQINEHYKRSLPQ